MRLPGIRVNSDGRKQTQSPTASARKEAANKHSAILILEPSTVRTHCCFAHSRHTMNQDSATGILAVDRDKKSESY